VSSPSAFAATSATSTPREQARKAAQGSRQAGAVVEASRRARMAAGLRMAPRRKLIATCRSATPQTPRWAAAPLCPGRHPAFAVEVVPAELRREGKVRSESKTDYRGVGRQGGIPCSCVTRAAPSVPLTASSSVRRMGVGEDTRSGQAETVTFYSLPGPGLNIILEGNIRGTPSAPVPSTCTPRHRHRSHGLNQERQISRDYSIPERRSVKAALSLGIRSRDPLYLH
jgi:hypothetical protein